MRKIGSFLLKMTLTVSMFLVVVGGVHAQEARKIGFVNIEEVLATSDIGKAANEEFKNAYEKNKKNIQQKEQELQRLKDEVEKQRPILTEQALKEKELSYQKKYRDYQDLVKDANDDLNARRQDLVNKYVPQIMKIVNAIGEKEKYLMIVDMSTVPIAYHSKESNVTKSVIEEFNKTVKKK